MRRSLMCLALFLALSCREAPVVPEVLQADLPSDTLKVICEIGELMGDSLYVFGQITSAEPVPEGVAVLDIHSSTISFYSREGDFIRSVGGHGEGPGEFLLPIDFAVLDYGRIAVADLTGRKIDVLSAEGSLIRTLPTEHQMLPYRMDAVSDSTFFVYYYSTEPFGDQTNMGHQVELWDTSGFVSEIWSSRANYDGSDYRFAPGYIQCCSAGGSVYISVMEDTDLNVQVYSTGGMSSSFISSEGVQIPSDSTDIGYDEPYAYVSFSTEEAFVELESEPLEYRPQVAVLGADGNGRLWVRRGTTDAEEWLVYSPEGEKVSTGTITGIHEETRLRYVINEYGAVAWAPYTENYPVLYVLSVE